MNVSRVRVLAVSVSHVRKIIVGMKK